MTLSTFYNNVNTPAELVPAHPTWVALGLVIFDILIVLGSFGYAFHHKLLSAKIWQITVIAYPVFIAMEIFFDFSAGGYTIADMFVHSLLVFMLTSVFVAPVLLYLSEFKKTNVAT